jgi:uncharacterized membrane protein
MTARDRAQRTYESAERLAHDRRARRAARKAMKNATALGDDVRSHGIRRTVEHDDTADRLGTIAESLATIARRSQRPRHRVWPWLVTGGLLTAAAVAAARYRRSAEALISGRTRGPGITTAVDVDVPVTEAYNQWTQFEQFPSFMSAVDEVHQLDDTHLRWVASAGGSRREWTAEVTEQMPDERIAWTSRDGGPSGVVTFHRLGSDRCRVTAQIGYEPETLREKAGHVLGMDTMQVRGDLGRFKQLIEARGAATGAWRGDVDTATA